VQVAGWDLDEGDDTTSAEMVWMLKAPGEPVQTHREVHTLHLWGLSELWTLLHQEGFTPVENDPMAEAYITGLVLTGRKAPERTGS